MADTRNEGTSVFRRSAMSRIASADDLDRYIKVTNPSAWVVLLASLLLLAGIAIWSAMAVIPTTVKLTGIITGNQVLCWVDENTAHKIQSGGAKASVLDITATAAVCDELPVSKAEVRGLINSDYLVDSLTLNDWNYEVDLTLPREVDGIGEKVRPVPVTIIVSETVPFTLVLGNR